ncbi:D-amino-acid transaminase [Paenibacillus hunanensis]|uniref:D-alanine aminotransferase n=1 Tax=Paenibacillus hunanensis TaxID=539262 RepID=A0ABU1IUY8_9BACL|nr:D-amino-acid transaminase [Paenibacillus hunanensis]MDR6242989.1 D-alanine transaminase [Paenibacillus hunanensis]GGJ12851.1 D-alanine aminotransferase [Paenibacillus hunanensis]
MLLWNGKLVEEEQVRVSYRDRGYYFGDGIYEVFRLYNGILFEKEAHLDRLYNSLREIKIELPWSREQLSGMVDELAATLGQQDGILYIQFTRGEAKRAHIFPEVCEAVMLGYCEPLVRPADSIENGIEAITLEDIRWLRCHIKSLNLLANTLAKQEAVEAGAKEAILIRSDDTVTECTASNLLIVKDGVIYTHPNGNLILDGITKQVVKRLAHQLDIPYVEQAFSKQQLMDADEVFLTSTTMEATPIISIDGRPVGTGTPGVVTRRLQVAYVELVEQLVRQRSSSVS